MTAGNLDCLMRGRAMRLALATIMLAAQTLAFAPRATAGTNGAGPNIVLCAQGGAALSISWAELTGEPAPPDTGQRRHCGFCLIGDRHHAVAPAPEPHLLAAPAPSLPIRPTMDWRAPTPRAIGPPAPSRAPPFVS